jgi:hypothetical protein
MFKKTFQREMEETENVKAAVLPETGNGNRQLTEKEVRRQNLL